MPSATASRRAHVLVKEIDPYLNPKQVGATLPKSLMSQV